MITRLHHVGIVTGDIDEAIRYYLGLLGCQMPQVSNIRRPGAILRSAMLPIGSKGETYVHLIEPEEGPGVKDLERGGEGTIHHAAFEVGDIEEYYGWMVSKGMTPVDSSGQPLRENYVVLPSGAKYLFLPTASTRGTLTEIVQVAPRVTR